MRWSDIPFRPADRTLRQFAGLGAAFFALAAVWQGWQHERWALALAFGVAAVAFAAAGLVRPRVLRPVFVGWMVVVFPVGWLVSRAVLAVLFYGMVTPVAVAFRLLGRDVLHRRRQADAETYWEAKPPVTDVVRYFRQY